MMPLFHTVSSLKHLQKGTFARHYPSPAPKEHIHMLTYRNPKITLEKSSRGQGF